MPAQPFEPIAAPAAWLGKSPLRAADELARDRWAGRVLQLRVDVPALPAQLANV